MIVIGKFQINELVQSKASKFIGTGDKGQYQYKHVPSCRLKCSGVQSVPFGDATPEATLNMHIANPTAAQVFVDQWKGYLASEEYTVPTFYAAFMTPADYEMFLAWLEGKKASAPEAMLPDKPAEDVVH